MPEPETTAEYGTVDYFADKFEELQIEARGCGFTSIALISNYDRMDNCQEISGRCHGGFYACLGMVEAWKANSLAR
jgi:hypothetical protein